MVVCMLRVRVRARGSTWRESDAASSGLVTSMSVISARHASFFEELSDCPAAPSPPSHDGRRTRSRGGDAAAAPSLPNHEGRRTRSWGGDAAAAPSPPNHDGRLCSWDAARGTPSLLVLSFRPKELSANSAKLSLQEGRRLRSLTRGGDGAAAALSAAPSSLLNSVLRPEAPPKLQKRSRNWAQPETAVDGDML